MHTSYSKYHPTTEKLIEYVGATARADRIELERIKRERIERERLERERIEKQRLERIERERLERLERERLERERLERERIERERIERERLLKLKEEQDKKRLEEQAKLLADKLLALQKQQETERLKKEFEEKQENERVAQEAERLKKELEKKQEDERVAQEENRILLEELQKKRIEERNQRIADEQKKQQEIQKQEALKRIKEEQEKATEEKEKKRLEDEEKKRLEDEEKKKEAKEKKRLEDEEKKRQVEKKQKEEERLRLEEAQRLLDEQKKKQQSKSNKNKKKRQKEKDKKKIIEEAERLKKEEEKNKILEQQRIQEEEQRQKLLLEQQKQKSRIEQERIREQLEKEKEELVRRLEHDRQIKEKEELARKEKEKEDQLKEQAKNLAQQKVVEFEQLIDKAVGDFAKLEIVNGLDAIVGDYLTTNKQWKEIMARSKTLKKEFPSVPWEQKLKDATTQYEKANQFLIASITTELAKKLQEQGQWILSVTTEFGSANTENMSVVRRSAETFFSDLIRKIDNAEKEFKKINTPIQESLKKIREAADLYPSQGLSTKEQSTRATVDQLLFFKRMEERKDVLQSLLSKAKSVSEQELAIDTSLGTLVLNQNTYSISLMGVNKQFQDEFGNYSAEKKSLSDLQNDEDRLKQFQKHIKKAQEEFGADIQKHRTLMQTSLKAIMEADPVYTSSENWELDYNKNLGKTGESLYAKNDKKATDILLRIEELLTIINSQKGVAKTIKSQKSSKTEITDEPIATEANVSPPVTPPRTPEKKKKKVMKLPSPREAKSSSKRRPDTPASKGKTIISTTDAKRIEEAILGTFEMYTERLQAAVAKIIASAEDKDALKSATNDFIDFYLNYLGVGRKNFEWNYGFLKEFEVAQRTKDSTVSGPYTIRVLNQKYKFEALMDSYKDQYLKQGSIEVDKNTFTKESIEDAFFLYKDNLRRLDTTAYKQPKKKGTLLEPFKNFARTARNLLFSSPEKGSPTPVKGSTTPVTPAFTPVAPPITPMTASTTTPMIPAITRMTVATPAISEEATPINKPHISDLERTKTEFNYAEYYYILLENSLSENEEIKNKYEHLVKKEFESVKELYSEIDIKIITNIFDNYYAEISDSIKAEKQPTMVEELEEPLAKTNAIYASAYADYQQLKANKLFSEQKYLQPIEAGMYKINEIYRELLPTNPPTEGIE